MQARAQACSLGLTPEPCATLTEATLVQPWCSDLPSRAELRLGWGSHHRLVKSIWRLLPPSVPLRLYWEALHRDVGVPYTLFCRSGLGWHHCHSTEEVTPLTGTMLEVTLVVKLCLILGFFFAITGCSFFFCLCLGSRDCRDRSLDM